MTQDEFNALMEKFRKYDRQPTTFDLWMEWLLIVLFWFAVGLLIGVVCLPIGGEW